MASGYGDLWPWFKVSPDRAHTTLRNHIRIQNGSEGSHMCIHANINASNVFGKTHTELVAVEEGIGQPWAKDERET